MIMMNKRLKRYLLKILSLMTWICTLIGNIMAMIRVNRLLIMIKWEKTHKISLTVIMKISVVCKTPDPLNKTLGCCKRRINKLPKCSILTKIKSLTTKQSSMSIILTSMRPNKNKSRWIINSNFYNKVITMTPKTWCC